MSLKSPWILVPAVAAAIAITLAVSLIYVTGSSAAPGAQDDKNQPEETKTAETPPTEKPSGDKADEGKTEEVKIHITPPPTNTPKPEPTKGTAQTQARRTVPVNPVAGEGTCYDYDVYDPADRPTLHLGTPWYSDCIDILRHDINIACDIHGDESVAPSADRQLCWANYLHSIESYSFRRYLGQGCINTGLTNWDALGECRIELEEADQRELEEAHRVVEPLLQAAIASDADVRSAEDNAWLCLSELGQKDLAMGIDLVDPERFIFWFSWRFGVGERIEKYIELDMERRSKVVERMELADQCAKKAGLYEAYHNAIMIFLRQQLQDNPDSVEVWKRQGWIGALESYGAPALHLFIFGRTDQSN